MGRMQAEEMAELCDQETALHWHLTSNHYPPLPLDILPAVKRTIKAINAGKPDSKIKLPDGVSHKRYGTRVPAWECCKAWHLDAFLNRVDQ
jgi:hypothetical protein